MITEKEEGKMGKTFAMSGIVDWLRAASHGKDSTKKREKDTKESIQEKIKGFKKTSKGTPEGTGEQSGTR